MTRDLRRYREQTSFRLIMGFIGLVFIVGEGLIWHFLGPRPAIMGLICLVAAFVPVVLIWGILAVMEWLIRKSGGE